MPELPEAERARQQIERALGREIVAVDDRDTYVCRPHAPGEIAVGAGRPRLTKAHRRGKFLWVETDGGPDLGLHLGHGGPDLGRRGAGAEPLGPLRAGLRRRRPAGAARQAPPRPRDRSSPTSPTSAPTPPRSRATCSARASAAGSCPIKAKLLDQGAIAGVGNLLADETLWRARLSPRRIAGELSEEELDRLRRELRAATRDAIRNGGVHTGRFMPYRERGGHCPRCGSRAGARHDRRAHHVLVPASTRPRDFTARRARRRGMRLFAAFIVVALATAGGLAAIALAGGGPPPTPEAAPGVETVVAHGAARLHIRTPAHRSDATIERAVRAARRAAYPRPSASRAGRPRRWPAPPGCALTGRSASAGTPAPTATGIRTPAASAPAAGAAGSPTAAAASGRRAANARSRAGRRCASPSRSRRR